MHNHYIPQTYLRRWAADDGKLCQHMCIRGRIVAKRVFPVETGYSVDLYTLPDLPPDKRERLVGLAEGSIGRALMFANGYRPDGANQHVAVVKFAGLYLDPADTVIFDRMRRKRNSSVYDTTGAI